MEQVRRPMRAASLFLIFLFVTSLGCAQKSPRRQTEGTIGSVAVQIDYGAPSVRGRTIWGGLEKYGEVWRAGANENTTVAFDKDVKVAGQDLPAGKYGFFLIPQETGDWVAIFSKKNDAWGAYSYSEAEDALRVSVTPVFVEESEEELMYTVESDGIGLAWEKARLRIPVE